MCASPVQVGEELGLSLSAERVKQAETDAKIVDRARDALAQLKLCGSAEQHTDYHVVLAALAPEKATARDPTGWTRAVADRLGVNRTVRVVRGESRLHAFAKAMLVREAFDEAVDMCKGPLKAGDAVGDPGWE